MYHHSHRHSESLYLPVYGAAAALTEGAMIIPGATADESIGVFMLAAGAGSAAPVDVVGLLGARTLAARTDADPDGGSAATFGTLVQVNLVKPGDLICGEYNSAVVVDVASYSSPTVTITSLADQYDGGWFLVTAGVGIGQLGYFEASASGSAALRAGFTTALDSTSKGILVQPAGKLLIPSSAGGVLINSYAASTNNVTKFAVIKNELTYQGKSGWVQMQPQLHHNLQLSGLSPKIRAVGYLRDLAAASID